MAFEPKELRGALFKNVDKEEGSSAPDYRGDLIVAGVKYRLAGWVKTSAKGSKFLSLAATRDDEKRDGERRPTAAGSRPDAEIPF
jgi:hypothetical protein